MKKKLWAKTHPISDLTQNDIERMFNLFLTCYDNVKFENFKKDISEKEKIILMKDSEGVIQGFSSLKTFNMKIQNKKVNFLFSGDTVISPDFWGTSALTMEFLKNIIMEKFKHPFEPVYWFLITKGYKTYLLLANNFINYYPRFDRPNTEFIEEALEKVSNYMYPGVYQKESGLLIFEDHQKLKANIAPIRPEQLKYPRIDYFAKRNPKWMDGEELACLGEVNFALMIVHPLKVLKKSVCRLLRINPSYQTSKETPKVKM